MKTEISIAIITKNRKKELEKCLDSIITQTQKPEFVIIIDNDPQQSAKKIISKKKYRTLKFSYHALQGSVPKCRNFAMKIAKTKYLGFTDDDCVLDKNWFEKGLSLIIDKKNTFVLGKTLLLNPKNIFALAQYARDDYWKDYNSQIFDTKNVILNLITIKKQKLQFDENCQKEVYDSADFDFDFALKKAGLKGKFCQEMILYHQETNNFKRFARRAYFRGYLAKYLDRKWQLHDRLVDLGTVNFIIWILKSFKHFRSDCLGYDAHMGKISFCKKILATSIIKLFERYYLIGYVANKKTS